MLDYVKFMAQLISVVIPAFNEQEVIPALCARIRKTIDKLKYTFEIIIVENGSTDSTLKELLKQRRIDKRFKILQLAKNVGCDGGITAGLQFVKGDAVIIMMADLQDIPELFPSFISKWEKGYEIVYGVVTKRSKTKTTRRIGTFVFYKLMNFISKGLIPENASDFRLIDKKVYMIINNMPEHNKFFRGLVSWVGFKQIGIPFERPERFAGNSKAYFKTVFSIALNAFFGFSSAPAQLQWVIFILIFAMVVLAFFIPQLNNSVILFAILAMNFILLIQNQYTTKILEEVRNRPHYIVKNKYGI